MAAGTGWTSTRRRSCSSRCRVTYPAFSKRSTSLVADPLVRPLNSG